MLRLDEPLPESNRNSAEDEVEVEVEQELLDEVEEILVGDMAEID
jgi:hypothetical protein